MVFAPSFAEDIIWQEDFSSFDKDDVPSGGTYNYACENGGGTTKIYTDKLAGGESPELLVAKKGGSFTAVVPLGGKSGSLNLSFLTNRAELTIDVTGATVGEKTRTGNSDSYPLTVTAGTESLTIKIMMPESVNSNARLDNIKLYQGSAKKPAGLSWGTSSRTVTIGGENNFPTLSNDNNLSVTYSSSETSVATIDGSGNITLVAAGTTVIKAEFAGNDEYEAGSVEYTLTVKDASSETPSTEISVAQALDVINGLEDGKTTSDTYKVKGYVVGTPDFQRNNSGVLYGNVNFDIADTKGGTSKLTVFRSKSFENANFTEETITILKENDEVVLEGKLQKYVKDGATTPELTNGKIISINGQTSSVGALKADADTNAARYNVAGQKVDEGYKGLVIKGGKKLIQK